MSISHFVFRKFHTSEDVNELWNSFDGYSFTDSPGPFESLWLRLKLAWTKPAYPSSHVRLDRLHTRGAIAHARQMRQLKRAARRYRILHAIFNFFPALGGKR